MATRCRRMGRSSRASGTMRQRPPAGRPMASLGSMGIPSGIVAGVDGAEPMCPGQNPLMIRELTRLSGTLTHLGRRFAMSPALGRTAMPSTWTGSIAKQRNGERSAVPVVQNDLRNYFDEDFKSIGHLCRPPTSRSSKLCNSPFVICGTFARRFDWRFLK